MTQLSLYQPTLPFAPNSATSREAAESSRESAATMRFRVYQAIRDEGPHGATDEEMQWSLRMNPSTQRPRRGELVTAGMVRDSGRTRPTSSGRRATVWVVA